MLSLSMLFLSYLYEYTLGANLSYYIIAYVNRVSYERHVLEFSLYWNEKNMNMFVLLRTYRDL